MSKWQPIKTCPETDTVWLIIQGNLPWIGFKLNDGTWGRIRDFPPIKPPTHWMPILIPDPPATPREKPGANWQQLSTCPVDEEAG